MDFPRAWAIARGTDFFRHDPKCSYAISKGGVLCDCHVLTQHPEYMEDYGFLKKDIREVEKLRINKTSGSRPYLGLRALELLIRLYGQIDEYYETGSDIEEVMRETGEFLGGIK